MNTPKNPTWFDLGSSRGQAARLNPVEGIKTDTEFLMSLMVQMANVDVTPEQKELATKVALEEADKGPVTILSLVTAWDAMPELREFSASLRKATLPGPYGEAFINPLT
jgi:hypothetical protein